jgi:hypothetical protein
VLPGKLFRLNLAPSPHAGKLDVLHKSQPFGKSTCDVARADNSPSNWPRNVQCNVVLMSRFFLAWHTPLTVRVRKENGPTGPSVRSIQGVHDIGPPMVERAHYRTILTPINTTPPKFSERKAFAKLLPKRGHDTEQINVRASNDMLERDGPRLALYRTFGQLKHTNPCNTYLCAKLDDINLGGFRSWPKP